MSEAPEEERLNAEARLIEAQARKLLAEEHLINAKQLKRRAEGWSRWTVPAEFVMGVVSAAALMGLTALVLVLLLR